MKIWTVIALSFFAAVLAAVWVVTTDNKKAFNLVEKRILSLVEPNNQEAIEPPKASVSKPTAVADNHSTSEADKRADTDAQAEADKAALVKVMKEAVAARHGGVLPKTMSEEDIKASTDAAIKWKAKQTTARTKRELEAMKVKPAPSEGTAEIYIAKEAIRSALRDPDSAVFGDNVFFANDRKMNGYYVPVVCGSVNAKNGFGGMAGQKRFVFFPTLEGRLALEGSVADAIIVDYWNKMCAGKHG